MTIQRDGKERIYYTKGQYSFVLKIKSYAQEKKLPIINQLNFLRCKKPLLVCKNIAINNIIITKF